MRAVETLKAARRRWLRDTFHRYYYEAGPVWRANWLGVPVRQAATDLVVLQEILWDTRPDLIVETGTLFGGTARFFAHVLDAIGTGEIVSIDIDHSQVADATREHERVRLITADSTAPETVATVRELAAGRRVMLHLDADHTSAAVLAELRAYGDLVTPGCYAIVGDTNLGGRPLAWPDPGPFAAAQTFLAEHRDFEVDHDREYQLLTMNPDGFLRRLPSARP